MADVITRFKLETTQYDSKLRDAAKGLKEVAHQAELGGKGFTGFNQKAIEAASSLGTIESGANNTKNRLKDLVGSFNDAAKAYNNLSKEQQQSDFGKAMAQSLTQLNQRIKETKQELYGLGNTVEDVKQKSGGLFGGDMMSGMLQVFGGNVMTKIAGMGIGLVGELKDAVSQGIELAKQGEGIRIAFERLGRGDILKGLREATHGTVTDLELMKAAVKFNDFKLPLDELGTMLAFAQQKAKDTGQSVDYMVDSIVTGLGRKSLMILDNLGLSAAEIRDKMKETGDMTKAVGEIIREQMSKAGDYVETAADRALQANVSLQNKMEELGRKFSPLQEASNNLWTSIKIGIMDIVGGPLTNFINKLTEAGRLANQYGILGGSGKTGRLIQNLQNAREGNREGIYQQQQAEFWKYINPREQQLKDIRAWQRGERGDALQKRVLAITNKYGSLDATKIQAEVDSAKKMLSEYQQAAKPFLNKANATTETTTPTTTPSGGGRTGGTTSVPKELTEMQEKQQRINELTQEYVDISGKATDDVKSRQEAIRSEIAELQKAVDVMKLYQEQAHGKLLGGEVQVEGLTGPAFRGFAAADLSVPGLNIENGDKKKDEKPKQEKDMGEKLSTLASGLSTLTSGIESLGFEIPDGVKQFIGAIQGVASIIQGIQTVISVFQTSSMTANTAAIIANTAALTSNSMSHVIPFMMANGGVAHAASGYSVPGNHFSGDMVPLMVNSGELILNRAQQGNLASQLTGGGLAGLQLEAVVRGEDLRFIINSNGRRTGRGEIVTTNFR